MSAVLDRARDLKAKYLDAEDIYKFALIEHEEDLTKLANELEEKYSDKHVHLQVVVINEET